MAGQAYCTGLASTAYACFVARKPKKSISLAEHLTRISKRGGKSRMDALTAEERQALASKGGKRGGNARAKALTPDQRSRIARQAALAMWRKRRASESEDQS